MKVQYAKIPVRLIFIVSLLAILAGCGGSGSSHGEAEVGKVEISAEPQSLPADGKRTSTLTVNIVDSTGAAVKEGTSVSIHTNLGTIIGDTKTKDDSGTIILTFKAGTTPGQAKVVAEADGARDEVVIELSGQEPASIDVAENYPDPESITIKGTGGSSSSRIVFDVKDSSGESVIDGYRVNFSIVDGPDGGEELEPASATTLNGQVQTNLRSGTKSGPVSVKAVYSENSSVSTTTSQIAVNAGPPVGEEFGSFAQYLNVAGLNWANLEDQISVNVGDVYGNSVPDGTAISFKTYNTGGLFSTNSANTDAGLASATLISGGTKVSPTEGFLTITAEANNGGRSTHVTDIAVNPVNRDVMYVGTDGGGVYKSTDKGASWTNVSRSTQEAGQNFIGPYVNDITVKPDEPNTVYAATGYLGGGNIYRSLDGGHTWRSNDVEQFNGLLSIGSAVRSVVVDEGVSDYYVWAGTDGMGALLSKNGEDFGWGGRLVSGPSDPLPRNTGDGNLIIDTGSDFGPTLKTETWTVTYQEDSAILASGPYFSGSDADGDMTDVSVSNNAGSQTWTATYTGGLSSVNESGVTNPDDVALVLVEASVEPVSEEWTVTYRESTQDFQVVGSESGIQQNNASIGENYTTDEEEVTFYIEGEASDFVDEDEFVFHTMSDSWNVTGSVNGRQSSARTGVPYSSDGGEVSFTITSGDRPYENGDRWSFSTQSLGGWQVEGSKSGVQNQTAQTDVPYTSDNEEITFTIVSSGDSFRTGDDFVFEVQASGLGFGKIVRQIVKASGSQNTAVLYAATATGVFKSANGGLVWREVSNFNEDNIQTLAVHPLNKDTIYAGTKSAALWYSVNGGDTWEAATVEGLGRGLSASVPEAYTGNVGTGSMSKVSVGDQAQEENWRVEYNAADENWTVTGTVSGEQDNLAQTGTRYQSDNGEIAFTISEGDVAYGENDQFTFSTSRDPGKNIKAVLPYADESNNYLYVATYYQGALEPSPVGNVYGIDLDGTALYAPKGAWKEASSNLPQYDPPLDTNLFPQHALALDDPSDPRALFIGGEGINFYKATNGLNNKSPDWFESKSGLSNRIMARMPILFSGECSMDISLDTAGGIATFTVYIQDVNGNPPVVGSNFTVVKEPEDGDTVTLRDIDYPDTYTYQGTFRNPADAETNNPYVIRTSVAAGDKVILTFTPTCDEQAPGCSGQDQEVTYSF